MYMNIWLSCSLLCSPKKNNKKARRIRRSPSLFCLLIISTIVFYVYRKCAWVGFRDKCCFCLLLWWEKKWHCWDLLYECAYVECVMATKTIIWLFNRNHNSSLNSVNVCVYSKHPTLHPAHIHSVYVLSLSVFGLHTTSNLTHIHTHKHNSECGSASIHHL